MKSTGTQRREGLKASIIVMLFISASLAVIPVFGQARGPAAPAAAAASRIPRMPDGKPNLTGLWQALGTAYWDIRDHGTMAGPFYQLGALGAMPEIGRAHV